MDNKIPKPLNKLNELSFLVFSHIFEAIATIKCQTEKQKYLYDTTYADCLCKILLVLQPNHFHTLQETGAVILAHSLTGLLILDAVIVNIYDQDLLGHKLVCYLANNSYGYCRKKSVISASV